MNNRGEDRSFHIEPEPSFLNQFVEDAIELEFLPQTTEG